MAEEDSDIISRLMPDGGGGRSGPVTRLASASKGASASTVSVDPQVLRGAAGEAHGIAGDLKRPTNAAMLDGQDAAGAMRGWQLGSMLGSRLDGWEQAYRSLMERVGKTGVFISDAANGFEWTDEAINSTFPGVDAFDISGLEKALGYE